MVVAGNVLPGVAASEEEHTWGLQLWLAGVVVVWILARGSRLGRRSCSYHGWIDHVLVQCRSVVVAVVVVVLLVVVSVHLLAQTCDIR